MPVAEIASAANPLVNPEVAIEWIDTSQTTESILCQAAFAGETNDVATLQRLLILAGEDSGQVDGIRCKSDCAGIDCLAETTPLRNTK
jgi:hypothetical protein